MPELALLDGDVLVYRIGFMVDKRYYKVGRKRFKTAKEGKAYCLANGMEWDSAKYLKHEPGKLENAYQQMDYTIRKIVRDAGAAEGVVYLSGGVNFRIDAATTVPYKGQRDKQHRPHHYEALRAYLVEEWQAHVTDGIEADDQLGIDQADDTIICTIDKDLLTVPGWHYNFGKDDNSPHFVDEMEAARFFWRQMLHGDRADNIRGIWPDTPQQHKKCERLLAHCTTPEELKCTVGFHYAMFMDDPEARMRENGTLLLIQQYKGHTFEL